MANCAIFGKGSDRITYFIKDCVQTGRDFRGSNMSVTGVKEAVFDVKWTPDIAEAVDKDGQVSYDKQVSDLSEALRFENVVVSSREDVNKVVQRLIREKYSESDEYKALRLALSGDKKTFSAYHSFVEEAVEKGRKFKEAHFG